jgi:hypothetical protein
MLGRALLSFSGFIQPAIPIEIMFELGLSLPVQTRRHAYRYEAL